MAEICGSWWLEASGKQMCGNTTKYHQLDLDFYVLFHHPVEQTTTLGFIETDGFPVSSFPHFINSLFRFITPFRFKEIDPKNAKKTLDQQFPVLFTEVENITFPTSNKLNASRNLL